MRGHHKVFLGMAAGVGKTYRMLQEGHAELEAGRDVVIGYLEPHGRAETEAAAAGLPQLARRRLTYKDVTLAEMDLPGLLLRAPELALIDELAHTNAPGAEHAKRHEDVADVLAAGIDVFSTVNVQHLESLNDQVAELTGVRVRETFPDAVLSGADEVVLVDVTPAALIERLQAGKVYKPERVPAALNGFFRVENLDSLRELALRQVAEDVEARRLVREPAPVRDEHRVAPAQAVGERLLALATPQASSQRVVRRAWRSAQRLGADLDVLTVLEPGTSPRGEIAEQLDALRRLGSLLGVTVLVEEDDDVAEAVVRVVRERGSTYVLMGPPAERGRLARLVALARRAAPAAGCRASTSGSWPTGRGGSDEPRRRPDPARRAAGGDRGDRRRHAPAPQRGRAAARAREDPLPVRRHRALRARAAGDAAAGVGRAGGRRPRLPRHRAAAVDARRAGRPGRGRRVHGLRGDRAAGRQGRRPVDGRIARGRNVRHALRRLMAEVPAATRIVIATDGNGGHDGFGVEDVAWLLRNAQGEVLVVRPDPRAPQPAVLPERDPLLRARAAA